MNKVFLIGKLGGDPKTTTFENGKKVTKFSLATSEFFGDKKETTWHNIDIWGVYGAKMAAFIKKGSTVAIDGRISTNAYEKDGEKRVFTSIVSDRIELLDSKRTAEGGNDYNQSDPAPVASTDTTYSSNSQVNSQDDDLPF
jgi:single-strand DNA-binding protein